MTEAERIVWRMIRNKRLEGLRFRRQAQLGPYYLDFFCPKAKLAVEIDGVSHTSDDGIVHDEIRTRWLETHGIRVLRFTNSDVFQRPVNVADAIHRAAVAPHPVQPDFVRRTTFPYKRGEG
jgi:very-short-patch-repair endonuclease